MNDINLNLARKWRSKIFDQIIGQEMSIRILKNSLYLNQIFPVYLFSGQRGCGKTSTARLFAAAVNCDKLSDFQNNPKNVNLPCLECMSCKAMQAGKHSDFIEIDAASHTGVDNVRQIIEASTFLPVMGKKKVYLIDEAHMLSKAAFNAFLKILEEPPASVLFILATTDIQKIIDTVRSRCFQIFFSAVQTDILVSHLEGICKAENILYQIEGLRAISRESEGSVRDAINLLEQTRFSHEEVTKEAVLSVLGHISDEKISELLIILLTENEPNRILEFLDSISFTSFSPEFIWNKLLELLRLALRLKFNSKLNSSFNFSSEHSQIIRDKVEREKIILILESLCNYESVFLKTSNKHSLLEILFINIIIDRITEIDLKTSINRQVIRPVEVKKNSNLVNLPKNNIQAPNIKRENEPLKQNEQPTKVISTNADWASFLNGLKDLDDPLMNSIFSQAEFLEFNNSTKEVIVAYGNKFNFFKDIIDETKTSWNKILQQVFGNECSLKSVFKEINDVRIKQKEEPVVIKRHEEVIKKTENKVFQSYKNVNKDSKSDGPKVDVSDSEQWKLANTLLKKFSGTIHEMKDDIDG